MKAKRGMVVEYAESSELQISQGQRIYYTEMIDALLPGPAFASEGLDNFLNLFERLAHIFASLASLFLHHDHCAAFVLKIFRLDWFYGRHFSLTFVVLLLLLISYKLTQLLNFKGAFVFFPP